MWPKKASCEPLYYSAVKTRAGLAYTPITPGRRAPYTWGSINIYVSARPGPGLIGQVQLDNFKFYHCSRAEV